MQTLRGSNATSFMMLVSHLLCAAYGARVCAGCAAMAESSPDDVHMRWSPRHLTCVGGVARSRGTVCCSWCSYGRRTI